MYWVLGTVHEVYSTGFEIYCEVFVSTKTLACATGFIRALLEFLNQRVRHAWVETKKKIIFLSPRAFWASRQNSNERPNRPCYAGYSVPDIDSKNTSRNWPKKKILLVIRVTVHDSKILIFFFVLGLCVRNKQIEPRKNLGVFSGQKLQKFQLKMGLSLSEKEKSIFNERKALLIFNNS